MFGGDYLKDLTDYDRQILLKRIPFLPESIILESGMTQIMEDRVLIEKDLGETIVPILSQLQSGLVSAIDVPGITKRVQFAGDEVVNAKEGGGSATLAMAYAAASFTASVLRAMDGESNVIEPGFVRQHYRECEYLASQLRLGTHGVEEAVPLPRRVTRFERKLLQEAIPQLVTQAEKGIDYAKKLSLSFV